MVMGASLIVLSGPSKGRSFELRDAEVTLGRHDSSSWPIPDPAISRRHWQAQNWMRSSRNCSGSSMNMRRRMGWIAAAVTALQG